MSTATATAPDFMRRGLTYRQLDHWTTRGYLVPDVTHPGYGRSRCWPFTELRIAELMVRLVGGGMEVGAAHRVARSLGPDGHVEFVPGVTLAVAA